MSEVKLPSDWIKCKSKKHTDRHYYFNKSTGASSWDSPPDSSDSKNKKSSSADLARREGKFEPILFLYSKLKFLQRNHFFNYVSNLDLNYYI